MDSLSRQQVSRLGVAAVVALALASPAGAIDLWPDTLFGGDKDEEAPKDANVIFDGGQQYFKLVPNESDGGGANDQPVELTSETIEKVFRVIEFEKEPGVFSDTVKRYPLFSSAEVSTIARELPKALAQAGPGQDVIFVTIGFHRQLIADEAVGTAGRVFYKDGKLNLILGDVHKPMVKNEAERRALAAGCADCIYETDKTNYTPGRREKRSKMPDPMASFAGIDAYRGEGRRRADWLIIEIPQVLAALNQREVDQISPQVRRQAEQLTLERRRMREEMARMRKEMSEGQGSRLGAEEAKERLATLNELHRQGLITEEEYRSKRSEILDGI